MAIRSIPQPRGTLEITNIAYDLGRATVSDHTGRDIPGNDTSSADYAVLTDDHPGEYGAINAYLSSLINIGTSHTFQRVGAAGMNIISQRNPGGQKNVVLDDSELGNIDLVMYLDITSYATTVVDYGIVPDTEIISYVVFLSDNHIMSSLQVATNAATTKNVFRSVMASLLLNLVCALS